jgi:hypothetical protein
MVTQNFGQYSHKNNELEQSGNYIDYSGKVHQLLLIVRHLF